MSACYKNVFLLIILCTMAASFSSAAAAEEWVDVDEVERREVYEFSHDQFPDTCLKKKATAVTKGGLTVKIERFGQEVELDEIHTRVIRNDWGSNWEKNFYRELNTFGFAVVKPVPHERVQGEAKMLLVPWNKYKLSFTASSVRERKYYVTYLDASYADDTSNNSRSFVSAESNRIQANENNKGYPTWFGGTTNLIFVAYPPRTDGKLTSPIATMRHHLLLLKHTLENEDYESYWARRPLVGFETVRDVGGGGNRDTMVSFGIGQFANGDMSTEKNRYRFQKNLESQIDLMLAAKAARESRMLSVNEKLSLQQSMFAAGQAQRPEAADTNLVAFCSPSEHKIAVPVNQHMVNGPQVGSYNNFKNLWDALLPIAYATMEIPQLVMNPGGSQIKGDPQLALHEWDEHIQSEQTMLNSMFEEMYSVAYNERARRYINTFYKAWKQETRTVIDRAGKPIDASQEPYFAAEEALKKIGKNEIVDELRRGRERELRDSMKGVVRENIRVIFSHNHTATVTFQDLNEAFSVDAITEDYFVQQVARRIGVPLEQIPDEAAREKQRKDKVKRKADETESQLKVAAKYTPKEGGGGPPKVPKVPSSTE